MKTSRSYKILIVMITLLLAACSVAPSATPNANPAPTATSPAAALAEPTAGQPIQAEAPTAPPTGQPADAASTGAAPGRPLVTDVWTPGDKLGVGTAYTYDQGSAGAPAPSRVWFTLTDGAITDILYPTVGQASVRELSLLVAGADGVQTEISPSADMAIVNYMDERSLAYRVTTRDPQGGWEAVKVVVTDPANDSLITQWSFIDLDPNRPSDPYAYFVPHVGGSGKRDNLAIKDGALVAWDESVPQWVVVLMDPAPTQASVGFLNSSDGLTDLADGKLDWTYDHLPETNYGAATLALPIAQPVTLVVGFGETEEAARAAAEATLARGFEAVSVEYIQGWHAYLDRLTAPPDPDPLYWVSTMVLKAHEDKTHRGAGVASLSTPWGQCRIDENAREQGYRYVWPRDLYHVGQAYIALGDLESANAILAYLDDVLQSDTGAFPQNAFLDGTPRWTSLQMDEVADPILLAWALKAQNRYQSLVKPAAQFIIERGPTTPQERWEENSGYVPHSIGAQIAALMAAAQMAEQAGDRILANEWRGMALNWSNQLETWTFTTQGPLGDGRYFLRLTPGGDPLADARIQIANGGGIYPIGEVVDVSALELVRLGVRPANAASIRDSLPEIDASLRQETPNGPAWMRYSFDGYGEAQPGKCETGHGRLWPLFNGERGHYLVAAGKLAEAQKLLDAMELFANPGRMLPEQIFAETGEGSGSATPLAWAHAEYILLARAIQEGRVLDLPEGVLEALNQ